MPWIGPAIGVAGSLLSGSMGADAAEGASNAQREASAAAIAEQRRQYDLNRSDLAPWRDTGTAAQRRLAVLLGLQPNAMAGTARPGFDQAVGQAPRREQFTTAGQGRQFVIDDVGSGNGHWEDAVAGGFDQAGFDAATADYNARRNAFQTANATATQPDAGYDSLNRRFTMADRNADPVYRSGLEFGRRGGEDAINARAIAGGGYDSGATLKALTRFNADYGSTKANESRNRFVSDQDTTYNRLAGVSGAGQTATQQTVAAGTNMANNISELNAGAGNARAAGIVGGANSWGNAFSGVNQAYGNYQNNQTLQRLLAGRSSGSYYGTDGGPTPYYGSDYLDS